MRKFGYQNVACGCREIAFCLLGWFFRATLYTRRMPLSQSAAAVSQVDSYTTRRAIVTTVSVASFFPGLAFSTSRKARLNNAIAARNCALRRRKVALCALFVQTESTCTCAHLFFDLISLNMMLFGWWSYILTFTLHNGCVENQII